MSTFEELKVNFEQKWKSIAEKRAELFWEMNKQISQMPDVLQAPQKGEKWQFNGMTCHRCKGEIFTVREYVTINGIKHRAELECDDQDCKFRGVYDFNEAKWLVP